MKLGVLALQGDFKEHIGSFSKLGIDTLEIRNPEELNHLNGLVIPGGESTTITKLIDIYGVRDAILKSVKQGMNIWGTCAGMIVAAKRLTDPYPEPLDLIDIEVSRNWYGSQINSFEVDISFKKIGSKVFPGIFIRAPFITSIDESNDSLEVLARLSDGTPVAVIQKNNNYKILVTSFHPELTDDLRVHQYFVKMNE